MATDVKNDATLSTNLISYWELEEASGTRVDSHGSNDLNDINTVTSATGLQGDAASFNKANNEELNTTSTVLGSTNAGEWSISFWFYIASETGNDNELFALINNSGASDYMFRALYEHNGGSRRIRAFKYASGIAGFMDVSGNYGNATWHHVVFTYNNGVMNLYVDNGTPQTITDTSTSSYSQTTGFYLGDSPLAAGGRGITGRIDEVGVWDRELDSTDVSNLYNAGAGIPYDAGGGGGATFIPIISMIG